jgi:GMP synthase (glutamine-hydrolysing)
VFEKRANELGGFDSWAGHAVSRRDRVGVGARPAVVIKSHHNVGGLPERMKFKLVEPLRDLFKDEVRRVGRTSASSRSSSSGSRSRPGLAVRCSANHARAADLLRLADRSWRRNPQGRLVRAALAELSRAAAGAERRRDGRRAHLRIHVAIRAVESLDGMTADWARCRTICSRDLVAHRQRGARHQSRGLRHLVEAASTIEWE